MVRSHWLRVCGMRLIRACHARFHCGSGTPIPWPRRIPQLAGLFYKRHATTLTCRDILPVSRFQVLFHSPSGVLFTFPSRYLFAIGSRLVFSLGSWSTRIRTGFLVPRPTQVPHHGDAFISLTGLSPSSARLSGRFCYECVFFQLHGSSPCGPTTPLLRFGLLRFRSPLLTESLLISFP